MTIKFSPFGWTAAVICIVIGFGVVPGIFNFIVDPYRMHGLFDLGLKKEKIATKTHGPLYKVIEYSRRKNGYVLFGDSRSRALRDKLFHEFGFTDFYNFAYSGGTIAEVVDSYHYAVSQADIKGVAIGVPLRSMDRKFSGGKNQVPEAVALRQRPARYFGNLLVADTGVQILENQYPKAVTGVRGVVNELYRTIPFMPGTAKATELAERTETEESGFDIRDFFDVKTIIDMITGIIWMPDPELYAGHDGAGRDNADGPRNVAQSETHNERQDAFPRREEAVTGAGGQGNGIETRAKTSEGTSNPPPTTDKKRRAATRDKTVTNESPADRAWRRRIEKGGRNDWKSFAYSDDYYEGLKGIAEHAAENGINLVFFIPPAHADMQAQIDAWERGKTNLEHRRKIARLGPVLDYDVPSQITKSRANYSDPYHFKANVARAISMDLMSHFGASDKTAKLIEKRRKNTRKVAAIKCPDGPDDPSAQKLPGGFRAWKGRGCVLWEAVE